MSVLDSQQFGSVQGALSPCTDLVPGERRRLADLWREEARRWSGCSHTASKLISYVRIVRSTIALARVADEAKSSMAKLELARCSRIVARLHST